jgi:hypothetical protein
MSNTILIKRSGTPNAVPAAGNLALGELAINYADGNLFYKDGSNQVKVIASNQFASVVGNVTGGNILTAGLVSATGNVTGNYILGNGALLTGVITSVANINNGTSNVTVVSSGGNVTVGVGGTGNVAVFATTGVYVTGVVSATGNVNGGNIVTSGNVEAQSAFVNAGAVLATGRVEAGTSMSAAGNITGANILTGGLISATSTITSAANITGGNLRTGGLISATGTITSAANISGGNVLTGGQVSATGNITANYFIGNGSQLTGLAAGTANSALALINGTTNLTTATNGEANLTIGGTSNVVVWDSDGQLITGRLSATGNVTGGNLLTGGLISATSTITSSANISGGNVLTGGLVSATANVTGGNLTTGGLVTATGNIVSAANITGGNLLTGGLISATSTITSSANITGGNVLTGGLVSATANVTGGNLITGGLVTATGNIVSASNITGGNLLTGGLISATANVIAGNVNTAAIRPTSGALTISTASGAINLQPAGNLVLSNTYINSVAYPAQDQDAASKLYVDNMVSTALTYHTQVTAATTTTLAVATGGTISYAQPNGAGNGVGATLTTTGAFDLIDTSNIQTVGTRVLVKNEANAVFNGVYTYANTTTIVRATDADEYGPASAEQLSVNDYFFVHSGNVNAGSAWVVDAPTGTITFGTSNISFAQFSSSQTYTANTSAGILLNGTVINAKTDGITTAFDGGGNIIVKASANLTTPNIGAATGTSLNVSGNVDAGNLRTGGLISATGTVTGSSFIGSVVTATGNITGGNVLTGGLISATGNITGGNVLTGGLISATGNITGGNANVNGVVNVTTSVTVDGNAYGNVVVNQYASVFAHGAGSNPRAILQARAADGIAGLGMQAYSGLNGQIYSNTGFIFTTGATVRDKDYPTGGTTRATIDANGLAVTGIVSVSGNIISGNILFGSGIVSGTGNIYGGNIFQDSNQVLDTTSTVDGGTY